MKQPRQFAYKRPPLYSKQEQALFTNARYGIVEATTKSGKTVGAIAWLMEQAVAGRPGDNFWWIAPVAAQSSIAFERLQRMLPKGTFKANATHKTITLVNQAKIWFKSGDNPDSLYGEDVAIRSSSGCNGSVMAIFRASTSPHPRSRSSWRALRSRFNSTG